MSCQHTCVVIGGGAAGFFGAIAAAENGSCRVILLEKMKQVLSKVRISGGGRCNVTHSCFEVAQLISHYPRGNKELRGAFARFQPQDTIDWFKARGVLLKTESDGRMFPITDSSETIINCLMQQTRQSGVELRTETGVIDCHHENNRFVLQLTDQSTLICDRLLIATGGASKTSAWLEKLGHTLTPPVPSLFTFNVPNSPLLDLSGVSVPFAKLTLEESGLTQTGPLLITHWGFSGPAVLKLSAWGARFLHDKQYQAKLKINWVPKLSETQLIEYIDTYRRSSAARLLTSEALFDLPKKLWKIFLKIAGLPEELRWSVLSKQQQRQLIQVLQSHSFTIHGKSIHKEEFVTCGGVTLSEVNFKTMESKKCPGLYFAGEVLDIDGVTGGFNFQNAWTTGWLAGHAMASN